MDIQRIREILDRREAVEKELEGLARLTELVKEREELDQELATITGSAATAPGKRGVKCSNCGDTSHNSRTCPAKMNGVAPAS